MPRMTSQEVQAYNTRRAMENHVLVREDAPAAVDKESKLFEAVDAFCKAQWPNWVQVYARTDKKSTLPVGCHDRTIFGPYPKVLLIEGKKKGGKPSPEQLIWKEMLRMLGWTVHIVDSVEQFLELTK